MQERRSSLSHGITKADEYFSNKQYADAFKFYTSALAKLRTLKDHESDPRIQKQMIHCDIFMLKCSLNNYSIFYDEKLKQSLLGIQERLFLLITQANNVSIGDFFNEQINEIDRLLAECNDLRAITISKYYFAHRIYTDEFYTSNPQALGNAVAIASEAVENYKKLDDDWEANSANDLLMRLRGKLARCIPAETSSGPRPVRNKSSSTTTKMLGDKLPPTSKRKKAEEDEVNKEVQNKVVEKPPAPKKPKLHHAVEVATLKEPLSERPLNRLDKIIASQRQLSNLRRPHPIPSQTYSTDVGTSTPTREITRAVYPKKIQSVSRVPVPPQLKENRQNLHTPGFFGASTQQPAVPSAPSLQGNSKVALSACREFLNCMKVLNAQDFSLILLEIANFHHEKIKSCWLSKPHTEILPAIHQLYVKAASLYPDDSRCLARDDFYHTTLELCKLMPSVNFDFETYEAEANSRHEVRRENSYSVSIRAIASYFQSVDELYQENSGQWLQELLEHLQKSGPMLQLYHRNKLRSDVEFKTLFKSYIEKLQLNTPSDTPPGFRRGNL